MSDRERDHSGAKYGQLTDAESERIKEEMKQAETERSKERAERCETCRYVHDCGDEWLCRRFPIYATKEFNDWCGEWDPKEEPDHREPIEEMFSDNQVAKLLDVSKAEAESIMQKMPHKLLPNGRLYVEKWTFRLWLSCQKGLPVQLQHITDLD